MNTMSDSQMTLDDSEMLLVKLDDFLHENRNRTALQILNFTSLWCQMQVKNFHAFLFQLLGAK